MRYQNLKLIKMKKHVIVFTTIVVAIIVGCKKDEVQPNTNPIVEQTDGSEPTIDTTTLGNMVIGEWILFETDNNGNGWESVEADSIYVDITDSTITGLPETQGGRSYIIPEPSVLLIEMTDSIQRYVWVSFEGNVMTMNGEQDFGNLKLKPR